MPKSYLKSPSSKLAVTKTSANLAARGLTLAAQPLMSETEKKVLCIIYAALRCLRASRRTRQSRSNKLDMRTSQKTNAAVKPKHPPKPKLENKQVAAASIKTPLERSSSKLVRLYSWAIFISFNVPLSSLWAAHLLSTPPSDPLKYAYTNYFRVRWGLLLYNTAVRVAVISLNSMQLLCMYTLCPLLQLLTLPRA